MVRLSALGVVGAERDGQPLDLGGPRQRAVLGLLVAAGRRTVSTDRFLDDLWSGEPPPKALGALQVYVSNLRRVLEPERQRRQPARLLTSVAPGYRLDLSDEQVDTWHFQALVREARAASDPRTVLARADEALALWTGEPFAAYADQEWASVEAARLWELHADAVQLRATAALDLGRTAEVVASLEAYVQAYPLREQGVRLLALALYRSQRQSDALAALAQARTRLVDELGVDPSPELRELEHDILHHAAHLRAPALSAEPVATVPDPVPAPRPAEDQVFGRADDLARLKAALTGEGPAVVWVSGEAGIGKTTLVDRFCDESVTSWTVARGRCPEVDGAPPAWAWSGVLGDLRGTPVEPAEIRESTAFDLAHQVAAAVEAAPQDVLLVLDDLHRADGETLQVLRHLLSSARRRVVVVGTFRTDEVTTDLGMTFAATAELTRDRLELTGLSETTCRAVLESMVDVDLAESVFQQLLARAGGNPLFLKHVARLAVSEGGQSGARELPRAIRDLFTRRLERLPGATVDVLSRAALLGRDIDLDLLIAMETARGTSTEDDIVDALDAGIVAGLVQAESPTVLRFSHALVRDTLYDRLPPMRRQRLHAAALDILEREHPDRTIALAHHAAAALDPRLAGRAATHLDRAVDDLLFVGSHVEAARLGHLALEAHEMAGSPVAERLKTRRLLMHATAATGDLPAAHALRRETIALADRHGTVRDRRMALIWIAPTVWSIREMHAVDHDLVHRIRTALAELDDERSDDEWLRVALLATLSRETEGSEMTDLAEESAAEAVRRAEALGDGWMLCVALTALYLVSFPPRDHGLLRATGERLLEASRAAGLSAFEAIAHYALFGAAAGDGDIEAATGHLRDATQSGTAGQLPLLLVVAGIFQGLVLLLRGQLDESAATYRAVTQQLAASGDPNGMIMQIVLDFTVSHARGDTSPQLEVIREVDALTPYAHDYLVCALLDAGDVAGARAQWSPQAPVKHDYLWLFNAPLRLLNALRLDDRETVAQLHAELEPWRGHFAGMVAGTATLGPVDLYLGMAGQYLGLPGADDDLRAAEEIATRHGAHHWAERARELVRS